MKQKLLGKYISIYFTFNKHSLHPTHPPTRTHMHTGTHRQDWVRSSLAGKRQESLHCHWTPAVSCELYSPLSHYCHALAGQVTPIPILQRAKMRLRVVNLPKVKQFISIRSVWVQRLHSLPVDFNLLFFLHRNCALKWNFMPSVYQRNKESSTVWRNWLVGVWKSWGSLSSPAPSPPLSPPSPGAVLWAQMLGPCWA